MRKRVTVAPAPASAPALTTLTAIPAGYAILPFGRDRYIPVRVRASGGYLELSDTGRTGGYDSYARALAVIAAYPAWRARQDEVERGREQAHAMAAHVAARAEAGRGKRGGKGDK